MTMSQVELHRINNSYLDVRDAAEAAKWKENSTEQYLGVNKTRVAEFNQNLVRQRNLLEDNRQVLGQAYKQLIEALDAKGIH